MKISKPPKPSIFLVQMLFLCIGLIFGIFSSLPAQTKILPFTEVDLTSLEDFESATENWQVAGGVFMDTYQDGHVQALQGTGVLVNTAKGDQPQDIYTSWQHGDIDLSLDFMMAAGSNSGIYLQGRYEIQLMDSWGVETPKFSDLGGIYQWWEDGRGVGGTAPNVNAALAPGVWQHMEIKFRAPRFNEQGKKVEHARLEEVTLNGKVIHTDLALIHPTGGAISNEEARRGPLRIQGDHGPVAVRNIRYKRYDHSPLEFAEISYQYYQGMLAEGQDPASLIAPSNLQARGTASELTLDELQSTGEFAIVYETSIEVEQAGTYLFELRTDGGHQLAIDDKQLIENGADNRWWTPRTAKTDLAKGSHNISVAYFRGESGNSPALSLVAEGPGIEKHPLHAPSAFPVDLQDGDMSHIIDPEDQPILMHGFMDMPDRVHPHSAAVGFPADIHFGIDLNNGSLMKLWKGTFLDGSTMWEGRGGGNLSLEEEAALTFNGAPSLAILESRNAAWPDSLQPKVSFDLQSYQYGDDNQLILNYQVNGVPIEDQLGPHNGSQELIRTLNVNPAGSVNNLYFRIAQGQSISELPNGLFQVNDNSYLINLVEETKEQAWIRSSGEREELLVPVAQGDSSAISYRYVW